MLYTCSQTSTSITVLSMKHKGDLCTHRWTIKAWRTEPECKQSMLGIGSPLHTMQNIVLYPTLLKWCLKPHWLWLHYEWTYLQEKTRKEKQRKDQQSHGTESPSLTCVQTSKISLTTPHCPGPMTPHTGARRTHTHFLLLSVSITFACLPSGRF